MATDRFSGVPALGALFLASCQTLSDPGIEYACNPPPEPYVEQFDDTTTVPMIDRCWSLRNADEGDITLGHGDLAIRHATAAHWQSGPTLSLRIEGDFMMVTKVEASSGLHSDFCELSIDDASGIVVRGNGAVATLLVTPYLEETAAALGRTEENVSCQDNAPNPARALVYAQSSNPDTQRVYSPGVGSDGEAEIALCRRGHRIAYLYRDPEDPSVVPNGSWGETWVLLKNEDLTDRTDLVGPGALDVGLTTSITQYGAERLGVEGRFNWVVTLPAEDCLGTLEDLEEPASD